ncbi:hypothetical protein [Halorubrum trapanicum]|uniref:hypothetical protein n=1 Tax=Halorubrum trapanicum TaxID=29284 RepID=UPI003C6F2606
MFRSFLSVTLVGPAAFLLGRAIGFWRVRLAVGKLLALLPDDGTPDHVRVLPPPRTSTPERCRRAPRRPASDSPSAFSELVRAYFHAYDREG